MKLLKAFAVTLLIAVIAPVAMAGPCSITGEIEATPNTDPGLPAWTYTLTVTWDTGTDATIDHFDLLMDPVCGGCGCEDFQQALTLVQPAGGATGVEGCNVPFDSSLECEGDPMIPGATGRLLKFSPDESGCALAPGGTATVVFYSDQPPVPVNENILSLVDRWGYAACFGHLGGVFPAMACDPVPTDFKSWGTVKGLYR